MSRLRGDGTCRDNIDDGHEERLLSQTRSPPRFGLKKSLFMWRLHQSINKKILFYLTGNRSIVLQRTVKEILDQIMETLLLCTSGNAQPS